MKIWVDLARPILTPMIYNDRYSYAVLHWEVSGKYLIDEKACSCGALPFSLTVNPLGGLDVSIDKINTMIEQCILQQLQDQSQ